MSSSITVFVEDDLSGKRPTANLPINGRSQTFAALFGGDGVKADLVGVNGDLPQGILIKFGPPKHPGKFTIGEQPTRVADGVPTDVSTWMIAAEKE